MADQDREMLELAAKAAGLHANQWAEPDTLLPGKGGWVQFVGYGRASVWNPLTDDGDCARMEAALQIDVLWIEGQVFARRPDSKFAVELFGNDHQAARRRASTRAAAEHGRRMKEAVNG